MLQFICYPKCTTCQKAQKWLEDNKIDYRLRDIKQSNPSLDELTDWYKRSGLPLKRFFNTSGLLYKSLDLKNKLPQMTDDEMLSLLAIAIFFVSMVSVTNGILQAYGKEKLTIISTSIGILFKIILNFCSN